MCCAPFPQVYFDRHVTPSITLFDRNEIDTEAAKNALAASARAAREPLA